MQTQYSIELAKGGKPYAFDLDTLPAHVVTHAMEYGLRQIINDATSSVKVKDANKVPLEGAALAKAIAEAEALADKRYAKLLSGNLRASGGGRGSGDPVKAEAMRLAIKAVEKAIVKKGEKVKDHTSAEIRARAAKAVETNPAWMVQAKVNVEAVAEMEIDD